MREEDEELDSDGEPNGLTMACSPEKVPTAAAMHYPNNLTLNGEPLNYDCGLCKKTKIKILLFFIAGIK